jgi:hypothetical protein
MSITHTLKWVLKGTQPAVEIGTFFIFVDKLYTLGIFTILANFGLYVNLQQLIFCLLKLLIKNIWKLPVHNNPSFKFWFVYL